MDLPCPCQTEAMLRPVVAVVGPTAAGKSELSLALARALDGEVINADSMQLYQGMDIGTAKLTTSERGGIPHHLLDIWQVPGGQRLGVPGAGAGRHRGHPAARPDPDPGRRVRPVRA